MKALMSPRPRRGSCSEYFNSMSGAATSSTTARSHVSPQKSVNQRPTIALLSSSLLIWSPFDVSKRGPPNRRCSRRPSYRCPADDELRFLLPTRGASLPSRARPCLTRKSNTQKFRGLSMTPFRIGFLLYPNLTQLDMTAPAQILHRMPGAELHYL